MLPRGAGCIKTEWTKSLVRPDTRQSPAMHPSKDPHKNQPQIPPSSDSDSPQSASSSPKDLYNRIRVRVNGLLVESRSLLMVRLRSPVNGRLIWMPPGGGLQFGEPLREAAKREMAEETGIRVEVGPLWYIHELHTTVIHAVEFYYLCSKREGKLKTGSDPEYPEKEQLIEDVSFIPFDELDRPDVYPEHLRTRFALDYRGEQERPANHDAPFTSEEMRSSEEMRYSNKEAHIPKFI